VALTPIGRAVDAEAVIGGFAGLYRSKVEKPVEVLNEPASAAEAGEIVRGLIERIVLTPEEGTLKVELFGDLAVMAGFAQAADRESKNAGSSGDPTLLSLVAGTRNRLCRTMLR
jgi:hypothetical protein